MFREGVSSAHEADHL